MSEIKPALTPEEWARRQIRDDSDVLDLGAQDFYGLTAHGSFSGERRHALAALALHRQEFGFTWDDVDAARDIACCSEHEEWGRDLASRIAALLPPRASTDA